MRSETLPDIRYCTTEDGVSIAYVHTGHGPPLIGLPTPGFSHQELNWRVYTHIFPPLAEAFELVTYDTRGTGLSDRDALNFSVDAGIKDLEAVVQRSGFQSFALAGFISAAPIAIKYAALNPERVSHLILADGWTGFSTIKESPAYKAGRPLLDGDWVLFTETFGQVLWAFDHPEFGRVFAEFMRQCCEPDAMRAIWRDWEATEVSEYLSRVTAPTLVVQNKNSRWFTVDLGRKLAAAIPNASLTLIEDTIYATVPALIKQFVIGDQLAPSIDVGEASAFRAVLFTDLVGHTEMMSRLGDGRGREVLREHERITREVLAAHGGTEVKTMGDGFMASFGSVTKAVECAVALQRAFSQREGEPLAVRVGLNAGEPIEEDGDLFGATVILASRIAAKAEGGEILVADTVRGLCSGKGFSFADRGEFAAKGFEEPVRVHEVTWQD
jgi:class 3 adenylate cyclase/pimeloyl-ACP methyl ester carboxylesterase